MRSLRLMRSILRFAWHYFLSFAAVVGIFGGAGGLSALILWGLTVNPNVTVISLGVALLLIITTGIALATYTPQDE